MVNQGGVEMRIAIIEDDDDPSGQGKTIKVVEF